LSNLAGVEVGKFVIIELFLVFRISELGDA
jgi:hypothetical protein